MGPPNPDLAPSITREDVRKAMFAFPPGSSAGPSGLRPQHIVDAVGSPVGDAVVAGMTKVVQGVLRGQVPLPLRPRLAGSILFAGRKGDDDVRPLQAGEYARRLSSRVAVKATRRELRAALGDTHIGDALSGGVEIGSQLARSFLHRNRGVPGKYVLLVDMENAHNTPDRAMGLREIRRRCPCLSPFMESMYGVPSVMVCGGDTIASLDGRRAR